SGPLPPLRSSVGPLHFGDADLVGRVPGSLPEPLCHQMPGVVLPGADRGLVDEIRNRDAKPLLTARALRAKAARLLERKFIHRLRHRLVAIVAFGALRREDDRVIGRLGRAGEAIRHQTLSLPAFLLALLSIATGGLAGMTN